MQKVSHFGMIYGYNFLREMVSDVIISTGAESF